MRYISEDDFICTYHNLIIKNISKLINNCSDEEDKELMEEILICAKNASIKGISMEKRLYQYKNTIESLGYKRIRKKGDKKL